MNTQATYVEQSTTVEVRPNKDKMLKGAAAFWLVIVIAGQWVFALFALGYYGGSAAQGNLAAWNEILPTGIAKGDSMGNAALIAHLFFAVVLNFGGPLQFVPWIRNRYPAFHRWNGRIFVVGACIAALGGVYMQWTRGNMGGIMLDIGNTSAALLIFTFSFLAWRLALNRKFDKHRQWAFRLFMVVSVTWFFRIGVILWYVLTGGVGIDDETFTGPFITVWAFGQYLLPLALLELYFFAQRTKIQWVKLSTSLALYIFTLAMAAGLTFITMMFWFPFLKNVY